MQFERTPPCDFWLVNLNETERETLRTAMGDANHDGTLSAAELKIALNDNSETSIDFYVNIALSNLLTEQATVLATQRLAKERGHEGLSMVLGEELNALNRNINERVRNDQRAKCQLSETQIEAEGIRYAAPLSRASYADLSNIAESNRQNSTLNNLNKIRDADAARYTEAMKGISVLTGGIDVPKDISDFITLDTNAINLAAEQRIRQWHRQQENIEPKTISI